MLEARDVTFDYSELRPGDRPLLDSVSVAVAPEERVFLTAPSGTGKTMLCQLLAGYLNPLRGLILVDGQPLPKHGACPVQLIGQHPERVLDPRRRMQDSLTEAGWRPEHPKNAELLDRLGIRQTWLTRFPHELSGGELQRFCIARALLAEPRYLIADEISTMLDTVTQARVWQVILEEAETQGMGLLFTTHSPALAARLATRTVKLLQA